MTTRQKILLIVGIMGITALILYTTYAALPDLFFRPTESDVPTGQQTQMIQDTEADIVTVATNLDTPWEIAFLPDGDMLVTQRGGALLRLGKNNERIEIPVPTGSEVGEGGILGLALHPNFKENNWLYLYTSRTGKKFGVVNTVTRYVFKNNQLTDPIVFMDAIPGAKYHDGGRMAFGPDGYLYITTGDATKPELAQNTSSMAGKILRLTDEGYEVEGSPFENPVYSYGHRNPQGLTWDKEGDLWATEHGRSGIKSGFDELNLIKEEENYGWPNIQGDETAPNMQTPVIHSGLDETWAPADALYYNGSIFFPGLRGQSLYQAKINDQNQVTELTAHFRGEYGRLRTIVLGPDNHFYLTTSNQDGRGNPTAEDDRIIRIDPTIFF